MNKQSLREEYPDRIATGNSSGSIPEPDSIPAPPPFPESYREKLLPWYFRKVWIIIVALNLPPLALPMIIAHPTLLLRSKVGYSLLIPLLTFALWISAVKAWEAVQYLFETLEYMGV